MKRTSTRAKGVYSTTPLAAMRRICAASAASAFTSFLRSFRTTSVPTQCPVSLR